MIKRYFDIILAVSALITLSLPILVIAIVVKITSKGPALFWSDRIGQFNQVFKMPKFRSMYVGTPQLATHLMNQQSNPNAFITPVGNLLRKTSLDELPQIWSVLKGDMSIVGPRPALFNQDDLIVLRTEKGIHKLKPGITGWAQINGRDEIPIPHKVSLDEYYLKHSSMWFDLKIIALTAIKVIRRDNITH